MYPIYQFTTSLTFLAWFIGVFFLNLGKEMHLFLAIGIYAILNAMVSKKSRNRQQFAAPTTSNPSLTQANLGRGLTREIHESVFQICREEEDVEDKAKELAPKIVHKGMMVIVQPSLEPENEEKPITKSERKALVRKLLRSIFRNRVANILDTKQELERLIREIRTANGNREKRLLPLLWVYSRLNLHHPYAMNSQRAKWYKRNANMRKALTANIRSAYTFHSQAKTRMQGNLEQRFMGNFNSQELGLSPGA